MILRKLKYGLVLPVMLGPVLSSCTMLGGEQVGTASPVVRTSILPTSVPYYLNLCGQDADAQQYRLYSPSALGRWATGQEKSGTLSADVSKANLEARRLCTADRKIANGDPITVRLNRVGIGGLAKFGDDGKCKSGCKRDIAIVLDFNGNQALQKPIVAFYQRNVEPDGNLQFVNQTIFAQNEWYYRYPPSVRVRLYDVRDDKDRSLRANLENVSKGLTFVRSYIAGAAIAGPAVESAVKAAEQLIDGPRNRPILDMSFQLFPQQQPGAPEEKEVPVVADPVTEAAASEIDASPLSVAEVAAVQKKLNVDTKDGGVGNMGPRTRIAIAERREEAKGLDKGEPALNRIVREILEPGKVTRTSGPKVPDPTFGSPIYASQFIVFNETAPGMKGCDGDSAAKRESGRTFLGRDLPDYYYVPDGVRAGGGRVYAMLVPPLEKDRRVMCLLETPFVIFSITRENVAVAADVARRISDLQTKFAADSTVSEDAIVSLGAAYVDAELALAIDRVENTWRADQLAALLKRIEKQRSDNKKLGEDDVSSKPLAGASLRYRAYRLVEEYMGCPVNDQVEEGHFVRLAEMLTALGRTPRAEGKAPPYLKPLDAPKFSCPGTDAAPDETVEADDTEPADDGV
ncbi:hypothetical protein [Sphingopyxis fribergensis]